MNWIRNTRKFVSVIGSANERNGRMLGCAKAPSVMRDSKFSHNLAVPLYWGKIIEEPKESENQLKDLIEHSKRLAKRTKKVIVRNKNELLVFGGDHSCAIGTWSGVASAFSDNGPIGLLWVDAHLDAHTLKTSPTGNLHGTPVSHLLGYGCPELSNLHGFKPKINPQHLVIVGARSFEEEEHELLKQLNVKIYYMDDLKKRGYQDVMNEAIDIATKGTIGFGLSIDIDAFDPENCPAVSTPEDDGILANEFLETIKKLNLEKLVATEIAEFLPDRDSEDKKTEQFIGKLIHSIYSTKWKTHS